MGHSSYRIKSAIIALNCQLTSVESGAESELRGVLRWFVEEGGVSTPTAEEGLWDLYWVTT